MPNQLAYKHTNLCGERWKIIPDYIDYMIKIRNPRTKSAFAICVDIDGTIQSDYSPKSFFPYVKATLKYCIDHNIHICFITARSEDTRVETLDELRSLELPVFTLDMKDNPSDCVIKFKKECRKAIRKKYDVLLTIGDQLFDLSQSDEIQPNRPCFNILIENPDFIDPTYQFKMAHLIKCKNNVYYAEIDPMHVTPILKQILMDLSKSDKEQIQSFCFKFSLDIVEPSSLLYVLEQMSLNNIPVSPRHYMALFCVFQECTQFFHHKSDSRIYAFLKYNNLEKLAKDFKTNVWSEQNGKTNRLDIAVLNGIVEALCNEDDYVKFPFVDDYVLNEIANPVDEENKINLYPLMERVILSNSHMEPYLSDSKRIVSWDVEIEYLKKLIDDVLKNN